MNFISPRTDHARRTRMSILVATLLLIAGGLGLYVVGSQFLAGPIDDLKMLVPTTATP